MSGLQMEAVNPARYNSRDMSGDEPPDLYPAGSTEEEEEIPPLYGSFKYWWWFVKTYRAPILRAFNTIYPLVHMLAWSLSATLLAANGERTLNEFIQRVEPTPESRDFIEYLKSTRLSWVFPLCMLTFEMLCGFFTLYSILDGYFRNVRPWLRKLKGSEGFRKSQYNRIMVPALRRVTGVDTEDEEEAGLAEAREVAACRHKLRLRDRLRLDPEVEELVLQIIVAHRNEWKRRTQRFRRDSNRATSDPPE
ncbi:hypothetical protein Dda_9294 [Drechslerella dactyloides]|uniref:Uncharacterized protein n=1 Tax=Drechslerella dactyloides TaxID=74499 RepID=A0AAD6NF79_DREDA|nr:hypothetical protein Dda_9294 [Drechslerella dactyloides]